MFHVLIFLLIQPPLGAYCKRESAGKKVPEVPDYFSLSMELHDPQQQILIYTDVSDYVFFHVNF